MFTVRLVYYKYLVFEVGHELLAAGEPDSTGLYQGLYHGCTKDQACIKVSMLNKGCTKMF